MKNVFESVSKIIDVLDEANKLIDPHRLGMPSVADNAKKWAKKPLTAKAAKMKDPVHVQGMGVMEREQAERLFPAAKHTSTKLHKEEVELEEAKWETIPDKPASNLKRGDKILVRHGAKTIGATYLRSHSGDTDKPGHRNGHLVKYNDSYVNNNKLDTGLAWHKPEHIFHSMDDYEKVRPVKESISESNEGTDHISMTVPLFIRCLEWAKEDAKDDVEIHKFVENIVAKGGVLETEDYSSVVPK